MQIGYPALVPIRHGNFNLDVRSPRNNEGQPDALLRPALPSALPLCESLKRCRTYIEAQTPNCRIFGFPSSTGDIPILVTLTGTRYARTSPRSRLRFQGWVVSTKGGRGKRFNRKGASRSEISPPHLSHQQLSQILVDCDTSRSARSFGNRSHNTFLFQNRGR